MSRAVAAGRLIRLYPGVYAFGHVSQDPRTQAMAAVLACGPTALLSHLWALWLYGLARLPRTNPDVTVSDGRSSLCGVTVHRTRSPLRRDHNHGVPATTPARTLVDCVPLLTERQLRRAASQAQMDGLTGVDAIRDELAGTRGRRTGPLARLVSDDLHALTRSLLEDLLTDLGRTHGWPAFSTNEIVCGVEVDFFFAELGLVIEADGWAYHRTKTAFEDDHAERLHLETHGLRVVAVTYDQVIRHLDVTREQLERIVLVQSSKRAYPYAPRL